MGETEALASLDSFIAGKLEELVAIKNAYPLNVPVKVVSDYLGITPETLRSSLMTGSSPIGYAWRPPGAGRSINYISTLPFVLREMARFTDWGKLTITAREFEQLKAAEI